MEALVRYFFSGTYQRAIECIGIASSTRGIRIAQVFPETPAEKGGLVAGDLLFRIDGQIIAANRPEDSEVFGNMIKQYKTDSTILLSGMRDGMPIDMNITLSKRPPPPTNYLSSKTKSSNLP